MVLPPRSVAVFDAGDSIFSRRSEEHIRTRPLRGADIRSLAIVVFYVVACFYGYGALVHVLNIAGLGGFDWINAPFKWQVLDVVYLGIDLVVLFGFFARWKPALVFFFVAAISQIVLYTVLRAWILDVPEAYAVNAEQASYLTSLVVFHLVSLVLVIGAYRVAGGQFFRARGAEAT